MLNALPDDSYPPIVAPFEIAQLDAASSPVVEFQNRASARALPLGAFVEDASANPWREINALPRQEPIALPRFEHAEPTTLRERDLHELAQWFDRPDMGEIEEDVNRHLLMLFPEPCWEDEDFEFLLERL